MTHDGDQGLKSKGGLARAAKLTQAEKIEIARAGAAARWRGRGEAQPTAFVGELRLGETALPCAVLPNGTRVLAQGNFGVAFGRTVGGGRAAREVDGVPIYLVPEVIRQYLDAEVIELLAKPISYVTTAGARANGIPARVLPMMCDAWLRARSAGDLKLANQNATAHMAEVMVRALAQVGIDALVDEATGFQDVRPRNALQQYLEKLIRKELAVWSKKFPDEFYENLYRLKRWTWSGMSKNRYSVVAHYTRDLVYQRLAPGLLRELETKAPPDEETGRRPSKLHQWLTDDVGHPILATHLSQLLVLQKLALAQGYGWNRFVHMVDKVLPKKGATLDLPFDDTIVTG